MQIKKYSFSVEKEELVIDDFIKQYHFEEDDREMIQALKIFLAELITVKAAVCCEEDEFFCAVTLGTAFDMLENLVEQSGNLLLCYCIECMGLHFLSLAYERVNELFFDDVGKWMGEYHFLDLEKEVLQKNNNSERNEGAIRVLEELGISWEKGMLSPLKSVVFSAKSEENRGEKACHNCETCDNITCVFRKNIHKIEKKKNTVIVQKEKCYSYGISRIFNTEN